MRRLLLASALTLVLSPAIAREVKCDRHIENGHTLQKCEFVESPQAAVPPPAPPVPIAPPQHTCFATGLSAFLARPPIYWSLAKSPQPACHCVGREPGA